MEGEKQLELRMYFFVPYNISPIQQAIQAGHAALEFGAKYGTAGFFQEFVKDWKTWIILNGGTTNEKRDLDGIALGTLDQIGDSLLENEIPFSYFKEPDLNDTLTALCFICDERVWDRENYPDFVDYVCDVNNLNVQDSIAVRVNPYEELIKEYSILYKGWVAMMGGEKNIFLRDLIRDKRLA